MDVCSGLDELGREPKRLRRRVGVLEATRVRYERDVKGLCKRGCQLDVELGEHVPQHLTRRRRVGDDEVDVAEPRVVVVVVDVEDEGRARESLRIADPLRLCAVDREEHALRRVRGRLADEIVQRHERVFARQRRYPR